jgi:plasmid maintenance system antidote protein VapI
MEYVYGGKINKKLIKEVAQLFMKNFGSSKEELINLFHLDLKEEDKRKNSKIKKAIIRIINST